MATKKKTTTAANSGPAKKASTKKVPPVKKSSETTLNEEYREPNKNNGGVTGGLKIKKSYIIAGLAVVLIAALLYFFRSWIVVAMVNGQPVSRLAFIQELERTAGKQTMNAIITKTLIFQEAEKQNVSVTDDEVNKELQTIEGNLKKEGQRLDQVLTLQGMTRDQLVEQIRLQKLIEKLVGKNVKITDADVAAYIEANREALPQDQDEDTLKTNARQSLQQQKLNEEVQKWLENLQKNAEIQHFTNI